MPGRDGTGPMGAGAMTGRGWGFCVNKNAVKYGAGLGLGLGLGLACRRWFGGGFRKGFAAGLTASAARKDVLLRQKNLLQRRLDGIEQQLENL